MVWGDQGSACSWLHKSPYSVLEIEIKEYHHLSAPGFHRSDHMLPLRANRDVSPEELILTPRTEVALTMLSSFATRHPSVRVSISHFYSVDRDRERSRDSGVLPEMPSIGTNTNLGFNENMPI